MNCRSIAVLCGALFIALPGSKEGIAAGATPFSSATQSVTYSVKKLQPLPGDSYLFIYGMNPNSGDYVGGSANATTGHPVVFHNGVVSVLPVPAGLTGATAMAINDAGTIVGYGQTPAGNSGVPIDVPLVWSGNTVKKFPVLPAGSTGYPTAIGASGVIGGFPRMPQVSLRYGQPSTVRYPSSRCRKGLLSTPVTQETYR